MVSQKTTHTGSDVARVNKDEEPVPINDRIMTMRLPLQRKMYATFLSVYAPTMTNTGEVKEDKGKILARVLLNRLNQNISVQPYFLSTFQSPCRDTVSKALPKSMHEDYKKWHVLFDTLFLNLSLAENQRCVD